MGHQAIAVYLHEQHNLPAWWSQEVTVGYERIRGLREEHQTPRGYQVSVSKTLPVATESLYEASTGEETRRRWLGGDVPHIRRATEIGFAIHESHAAGGAAVNLPVTNRTPRIDPRPWGND